MSNKDVENTFSCNYDVICAGIKVMVVKKSDRNKFDEIVLVIEE